MNAGRMAQPQHGTWWRTHFVGGAVDRESVRFRWMAPVPCTLRTRGSEELSLPEPSLTAARAYKDPCPTAVKPASRSDVEPITLPLLREVRVNTDASI